MLKKRLSKYVSTQVYVATASYIYTGILQNVTDHVIVVRSIFPGYGDATDYVIKLDEISFVRLMS